MRCKYCNTTIDFKAGAKKLLRHSETVKHQLNTPETSSTVKQVTLEQTIDKTAAVRAKELELKEAAKNLEIKLVRSASRHMVSFTYLECIVDIFKECVGDSEIVKKLTLCERKSRYLANFGIGETYFQETVRLMKEADGMSIGFDESEMNKREECEIVAKLSHPSHGLMSRHFKTIELEGGDAEIISNTVMEAFDEVGVSLEDKLVSVMTDGTNTMIGWKSGVVKRLRDKIPGLQFLTSCIDHHLNNSLQKAVNEFDSDINLAMVNLHEDLGGSKGRSQKSRREFIKIARDECGLEPKPVAKMSSTRFRAIRQCIQSALHNRPAIEMFYKSRKKPTPRQKNLEQFFVTQSIMTQFKLMFVMYASKELHEAINFFEENNDNFHRIYKKMEELLRNQLLRFMDETVVQTIDDEGNVEKFDGRKLLSVDIEDDTKYLSKLRIKIGNECKELMKKLDLTPNSSQVKWFMKAVLKFHKTVAAQYMKYFKTGLESKVLNFCGSLDPKERTKVTTKTRILYMAKVVSKIVNNIDMFSGMDRLEAELEVYNSDDELKEVKNNIFESFWNEVGEVTEGGWKKYEVLPRFAKGMATLFNSNSECERWFSIQTKLSRDPSRNRTSQKMFDTHLQVKSGTESTISRKGCVKCEKNFRREELGLDIKTLHCHCAFAPVSSEMLENCRKSHSEYNKELEDYKEESKIEKAVLQSRKRKIIENEEKEICSLKSKMGKRETMLPPNSMLRIWETEKEKKSKVSSKSTKSGSSSSSKSSATFSTKSGSSSSSKRSSKT